MRPPPKNNPPAELRLRSDTERGIVRQTRAYRLITPLFGGGVEPGQCDPVTIVRATEIRGHLRFWWRATRGGQVANLAELKADEDALWGAAAGATGRPSLVEVVVTEQPDSREIKAFQADPKHPDIHIGHFRSRYSYVAFPLNEQGVVREPFSFKLVISFPRKIEVNGQVRDTEREVEAALWAWETFGGIGARTRRGFGALQLLSLNEQPVQTVAVDDLEDWLIARLRKHVVAGSWPADVPHLRQQYGDDWIIVKRFDQSDSAIVVWRKLFDRLKSFRHQRPWKPKIVSGKTKVPGRNRWPEADTIRELTGKSHPDHKQPVSNVRKFPRAAFGLPIMFEFKHEDQRAGDPRGKNELLASAGSGDKTLDRWGSPLILRPLACSNGTIGIAFTLSGNEVPDRLILNTERGKKVVHSTLTEAEAMQIRQSDDQAPLLNGETKVLRAFLRYLKGGNS